jgi:hypothetical protein
VWWWGWNIWCLLRMWDASFSVFSGQGVGRDGIFCVSYGCGDASFSVFSG